MQGIDDTVDRAGDAVDDTVDRAEDTARDTARDVQRDIDRRADRATDTVDGAERTVDNTVDDAQRTVDQVAGTADDVATAAQQSASEAQNTAENAVDDATAAASGAADATVDVVRAGFEAQGEAQIQRANAQQAASEEIVDATGDYLNQKAKESATGITPHAGMSIGDDEAGAQARAKKERVMADRAEQGWEDITSGELPSVAEGGAMLFQGGEITERMIMDAGHGIEDANPAQGMGPKVGDEAIGSVPGNLAGGLVGGVGMIPGVVGQLGPSAAADLTDSETKTDGQTPSEVVGTGDMAVNLAESQWRMLKERPVSTGILLAAPAVEAVPKGIKGYRTGRGRTIPYESITDASGARGGVSKVETSTDAPTSRAVSEVRSRAADQPDVVTEAVGSESVLYHTTGQKLGKNLDVGEGASELPGLWTAPDANSVGLRSTNFGSRARSWGESLKPRKPDFSTSPDRVAAFESESIRGMPEWAQGAGYEVRGPGGEVVIRTSSRSYANNFVDKMGGGYSRAPDQTTAGYKFLDESAQDGTAYVRATGSRTPELEAIYGPGTKFKQKTTGSNVNVRVGGREIDIPFTDRSFTYGGEKLPMDFYRRASEAPDETGGLAETTGTGAGEPATAGDIASSYRSLSEVGERPSGTPYQNYGTAFGATDGTEPPTSTGQPSPSEPPMPFDELGPTSPTSPSGGTGSPESPYSYLDETGGLSSEGFGSGGSTPTSTSGGPSSGGLFEESGPTSSPESPPTPSGPPTPFDEYGPTSPPSSPPSSGGPSSPPSGPPSSPPGWPPSGSSWSGSEPGRSPPGSTPSESPTGFGPSPFDPEPQRRRRGDDERRKDEEEFSYPGYGTFYTPYENPVASGAQVLFGELGAGFGNKMDAGEGDVGIGSGGALDETGGLQDAGFGDEMSQDGPIDEAGGLGDWTPF